jgi:hypothetical protein
MSKKLSFSQAIEYLNRGFNYKATGSSGMVTLKNASQEDCLILQSEDGGERVSLFAPFLERPMDKDVQKTLNLHFLHLNADLDALGSLRITLNSDSNRYSLCDGMLGAESQDDFVTYLGEVLKAANYLHHEITDSLAQTGADNEVDSEIKPDNSHYLKA